MSAPKHRMPPRPDALDLPPHGPRCGAWRDQECDCKAPPQPAPSAEPAKWLQQVDQIVDALNSYAGTHRWVNAPEAVQMLEALSRAGLAIVPASDVPTPEGRVMVEAAGDIDARTLEYWRDYVGEDFGDSDGLAFFAVSELARRAAKEKTDHATEIGWVEQWVCSNCTHMNRSGGDRCRLCETLRTQQKEKP